MNRITALAATAATSIALAAGSLAVATPTQAAPAKAAAYKVTARINTTLAIGKEDVLKIRGKVTPKAVGQKVVLQQRVLPKRTWKATGTARIKRDGTYLVKDDPSTPGTREYRVVKPASNGIAKGISKTLTVKVYGWRRLTSLPAGPSSNLLYGGATIGTDFYGGSWSTNVAGTPASIEYTIGRKCLELRSTYGLTDSSESGSSGAVKVTADGTVLANHALAVGTLVADETLDITNVFRVRFDLTTSAAPRAIAAIATPEVLCTR